MTTKSEQTKQFILDTVAPIFNQKGYSATSISDLTEATGLTKGAIYGNFKNKEELALLAFDLNVRFVMQEINLILTNIDSPLAKLHGITNFYRKYYRKIQAFGGCPVLNVGVDANNTNPELFKHVKIVSEKLQKSIGSIIQQGIDEKEIEPSIDPSVYGTRFFSFIEGAVFTSVLLKDEKYLLDIMNEMDKIIERELKK